MATIPGFNRIRLRKVGSTVENPLTFVSPGLTRTGDSVSNDVVTGFAGGLTINGGTGSADNMTIRSSSSGSTLTGAIVMVSGSVELRQGTTAQILRVYNTFTDSNNFERALISWTANTLSIGAAASGTGTLRPVSFVGASFLFANDLGAAVSRVTAIGSSAVPFGTVFANQFETPGASIGVVLSGAATNITLTGASTQTIAKTNGSLFIQTSDGNDVVFSTNGSGNEAFRLRNASGGRISLGTLSRAANGTVATVLGSLGPTGAATTVQEWLTVQSNGGANQRWIPMF